MASSLRSHGAILNHDLRILFVFNPFLQKRTIVIKMHYRFSAVVQRGSRYDANLGLAC